MFVDLSKTQKSKYLKNETLFFVNKKQSNNFPKNSFLEDANFNNKVKQKYLKLSITVVAKNVSPACDKTCNKSQENGKKITLHTYECALQPLMNIYFSNVTSTRPVI